MLVRNALQLPFTVKAAERGSVGSTETHDIPPTGRKENHRDYFVIGRGKEMDQK